MLVERTLKKVMYLSKKMFNSFGWNSCPHTSRTYSSCSGKCSIEFQSVIIRWNIAYKAGIGQYLTTPDFSLVIVCEVMQWVWHQHGVSICTIYVCENKDPRKMDNVLRWFMCTSDKHLFWNLLTYWSVSMIIYWQTTYITYAFTLK